jgi:hypothetical protein
MHQFAVLFALAWSLWHTSALTNDNGNPVFTVDGKPFYVYGAAFFYERIPADEWRRDLQQYRALGINTIDVYIMWNWHEPEENVVDFDGHTNPRRNLHALLQTIHELGFKVILRPGPVIRNEWRNGGYPDWLLQRPEYNMPLHDILEGRYPATATLQNAHADAAADEWMHNQTHLQYAAAWLRNVLHEVEPWSSDIIAIALDDDQGAYIDNDTWPAYHWHAYIDWLKSTVQTTAGTHVPLFINTYQMKVTASAPVWAWGNWYQSDAYRIGDHDIAQLAFSTALLQTQPGLPVMASEFQAGWLQGANETRPRAAAPENTTIALHELLQFGARAVVNFPVQDTYNPAGYEAPWANWFYAWDAALDATGNPSPRYAPTEGFGKLITRSGAWLATLTPKADVAIAWLPSAYNRAEMGNVRVAAFAATAIAQLQLCRDRALTCRFVDLGYDSLDDLRRTKVLIVPDDGASPMGAAVNARIAEVRKAGVTIAASVATVSIAHPANGGVRDAALLVAPDERSALFDVFNDETNTRTIPATRVLVGVRAYTIPRLTIAPGGALDVQVDDRGVHGPLHDYLSYIVRASNCVDCTTPRSPSARATDYYRDGSSTFVLENGVIQAVVSADAGARVFTFTDLMRNANAATTIGWLRDDVQDPPAPSPRDYIAAYTHPMPAGTFNRHYDCAIEKRPPSAALFCTYTAPDLGPQAVRFEKEFVLDPGAATLRVRLRSSAAAVSISNADDRIAYPANSDFWLTLSLQGPPQAAANPAQSR